METGKPEEYSRRILLCVTGLSPQVVTETLHALVTKERYVPTEIHLLTTKKGAEHARLMLIDPDDGRFYQYCDEYGLERDKIAFSDENIHIIRNGDEEPLDDITHEEDNTAVADTITNYVREFTADERAALHASIAGGRKTMGFYLGYALSLFGRPQDRLSHVLVSPPFESEHSFYYPPKKPKRLIIKEQPVHTSDARIMLADIPFVRLREGLPERLQQGKASFSATVEAAQRAQQEPELIIDMANRRVIAAGVPVELAPADFAFYAWFAGRCKQSEEPVGRTDDSMVDSYLAFYKGVVGEMSGEYEKVENTLAEGMDARWFDQRKSKTNKALADVLGKRLAAPYLIVPRGSKPRTVFGLELSPEAIRYESEAVND